MKFTCIVGTYNQRNSLGRTLEGINDQTFKDFEVRVCDDGSNYDVEREYKAWSKHYPIYFYTQEHIGMRLAKNLNQGIKKAKGEYIVVIMGDSYPQQDWLERLNEVVSEKSLVSSLRIFIDNNHRVIANDWRFKDPEDIEYANEDVPWVDMTGNGLVAPKAFYDTVGGWNEAYEGYGRDDWHLCLEAKVLGYKMFTYTKAIIYHLGKETIADNPKNIELFERRKNEIRSL